MSSTAPPAETGYAAKFEKARVRLETARAENDAALARAAEVARQAEADGIPMVRIAAALGVTRITVARWTGRRDV